jgi:hypothetical protein
MNLLDDIVIGEYDGGTSEGFEGQIQDHAETNKLAIALEQGKEDDLLKYLNYKLAKDDTYILSIIEIALRYEGSKYYKLSCWLLENECGLSREQGFLDFCLRLAVNSWRGDTLETFLRLGANPNQELLPQRTIYDVILNRTQHSYLTCNTRVEIVPLLKKYNAKSYLFHKFEDQVPCLNIIESISFHDSWCKPFLESISLETEDKQIHWCNLLIKCLNKSKKPTKKWLKETLELVEVIGPDSFLKIATIVIKESCNSRATLIYGDIDGDYGSYSLYESYDLWKITESSSFILKSFIWLLFEVNRQESIKEVSLTCKAMFQNHSAIGIRDVKLANAAYASLLECPEGIELAKKLVKCTSHKPTIRKMNVHLASIQ